jgi:hypothetical protein
LRLAVRNGHKHLVAKCCTGGGVQGDACALMIAVSSNNTDVLLLLLQAASAVVTWGAQEAMQLPLARLLTLVPPARHDDEETRAAEPQAEAGWACDELSSNECHLLDRIAHGCPYTLRQLQRAMAAAAAGGQAEVHLLPSARMMVNFYLLPAQVFQLLLTTAVAMRQPPSHASLALMLPPAVVGGHR